MLYLPSTTTILILVLQTTLRLTTITALEHFTAVPRHKSALLPRMEILGGVGIDTTMYIEVHPCAHSFKTDRSSTYTTIKERTFKACTQMESPAAWWSEEAGCTLIWTNSENEKQHVYRGEASALGSCFIFKPHPDWPRPLNAWKHPCEDGFSAVVSLWYTRWDMTYDQCKNKPNAGAWQLDPLSLCHMFPGPVSGVQVHNKPGNCFILDKVPLDKRYVEVHPCDKFFRPEWSALFSIINPLSTITQCKNKPEAVAWTYMTLSTSHCVPIWLDMDNQLIVADPDHKKRGLCFKFNVNKTPEPSTVPDSIASSSIVPDGIRVPIPVPYRHVCENGFKAAKSRWYSGLQDMTLEDCGKNKNVVAWRVGGTSRGRCFVFDWDSNTKRVHQGKGTCYILDKVVPLGSLYPPPWIVTRHHLIG